MRPSRSSGETKSERKRYMGHGFSQINTDKNIFYALRAGLSMQHSVEVNIYEEPEHSVKSFNTMTEHRSSIFTSPKRFEVDLFIFESFSENNPI